MELLKDGFESGVNSYDSQTDIDTNDGGYGLRVV